MENLLSKLSILKTFLLASLITLTLNACTSKCDKIHCDDSKCEKCVDCPVEVNEDILAKVKEQSLTNDDVFNYYRNYNKRYEAINAALKREYGKEAPEADTRSIVFDFKVIQEYLNHIENESKKRGVNPQGLKITLGVFPKESNYKYQTNVIFTPTVIDSLGTKKQSSYTLQNNELVFFKALKNHVDVQKGSFFSFRGATLEDGFGMNGGTPVPPPNNDDPDFD